MRDKRPYGFTLIELMVAIVLAGLIVVMGLLQTSGATNAAESRSLAEELAEELRSARRLAISHRNPVAVVFPSANGTAAHSRGFYLLEGFGKPSIVGGRRFDGDYPAACAFNGYWALAGPSNSRSPLPFLGNDSDFDLAGWQVPFPKDYMFVFTPSGHLMTNGLTQYSSRYHILVSEGVSSAVAGAPSGTGTFPVRYFQANRVSAPYTITLSSAGEISVGPGIPSANLPTVNGRIPTAPPPAVPLPSTGNSPPVLKTVTADPLPQDLPAGVAAVIPPRGYLTLRLEVTEPDGQVPFCEWQSTAGTFSSPNETSMEWDAEDRCWKGEWVWTPPENAVPGDEFRLRYTVNDGHGGSISGQLGTSGKVQIGKSGTIAFSIQSEIGTVGSDGVVTRFLTPEWDGIVHFCPSWQPGGNQLACFGWDPEVGTDGLYVINQDGTGLRALDSASGNDRNITSYHIYRCGGIAWSPNGTRLAYDRAKGTGFCLYVIDSNGDNRVRLTAPNSNYKDMNPSWSTDGNWILFERRHINAGGVWDHSEVSRVPSASAGGTVEILAASGENPQYSPDGTQIVYRDGANLVVMDADGSAPTTIATSLDSWAPPKWSPDGTLIAFVKWPSVLINEIHVTTPDGLKPGTSSPGSKKIAVVPAAFGANNLEASWAPDSQSLLFHRDTFQIYQCNVSGPPVERKVALAESFAVPHPVWKP